MKKILGTTRKVFLFENFVIKFPRILVRKGVDRFFSYYYEGLKSINRLGYKKYKTLKKRHEDIFREYYQEVENISKYQMDNTCQKFLFDGLMSNWHEFIFSIKNRKNTFTTPTYFSFFGLINIQKRGKEFEMSNDEFKIRLEKILEEEGILDDCDYWKDSHTMNNPKNFCQDEDGKLRVLDYGNIRMHNFLKEYGKLIQEKFIFE
ncbi:MAG: hypothetical protein WCJ57_00950 [Candidatus Falkowbacteria bacterium]